MSGAGKKRRHGEGWNPRSENGDGFEGRRECWRLHCWELIPNVSVLMIVTSYEF